MRRRLSLLLLGGTLMAAPAYAQASKPIPKAVFDLRGFYTALGQDAITAQDLGLAATDLPKRGLGGVAGLQFYAMHRNAFALGIGGELLLARGRAQEKDEKGMPVGLPVEQRLVSISPSVSLNFGHREGWSYVSAGMGPVSFESFVGAVAPATKPPTKPTINMGGGARWFPGNHLAFCFDVRFYLTRPEAATPDLPRRQRAKLLVMSAGIAFK